MRFKNAELLVIPNGDQYKTLRLVNLIADQEKNHPFVQKSIKDYGLRGSVQSIKRIFEAVHRIVYFAPDPASEQWIRTVNRSLKDQLGNCVDYTVALSAFLRALKIPHRIRMAEYHDQVSPGLSHIYIKLLNGITLDPVIGQNQDGSERYREVRRAYFNLEKPYKRKVDKLIRG